MQGTKIKRRSGYCQMQIGSADRVFIFTVSLIALMFLIYFAYRFYQAIPDNPWRIGIFMASCLVVALVYMNLGVWLHEQLHFWGLRGIDKKHDAKIVYIRKHILLLSGYYRVTGSLKYHTMVQALLGPILISLFSIIIGLIGSWSLPNWWLPLMMTISVMGIVDMTTDLYWYTKIRTIGTKGKYWDRGKELHLVWKE
jgi:hypothetical protein